MMCQDTEGLRRVKEISRYRIAQDAFAEKLSRAREPAMMKRSTEKPPTQRDDPSRPPR
jgi:hypothetical protein